MKFFIARPLVLIALLSAVVIVGCNNGGNQQGGPGADTTTDRDTEPQSEEKTFTADVSDEEMDVPQGQRKELTLSLDRGESFQETVEVRFEAPEGVRVLPDSATIEQGQTETKVMIEADSGANTAEHAVKVIFEPATGEPIEKVVTVNVVQPEPEQ